MEKMINVNHLINLENENMERLISHQNKVDRHPVKKISLNISYRKS